MADQYHQYHQQHQRDQPLSPSSPIREKDEKRVGSGFWGGLLRMKSMSAKRQSVKGTRPQQQEQHYSPRRVSDGDAAMRRRRPATAPVIDDDDVFAPVDGNTATASSLRRRPRRPRPEQGIPRRIAGEGSSVVGRNGGGAGNVYYAHKPFASWPPRGVSSQEELPPQHANELICRGATMHQGLRREVPHAPEDYFALYTMSEGSGLADETDGVNLHSHMSQMMTIRMHGTGYPINPWETLEQPSYASYYGQQPGSITLNQWAFMASSLPPSITMRDPGVMPRSMELERIFERLQELRGGLEDDDPELLYKILYRRMLRDPDKTVSPHKTLDKQITDLILVLSRPHWIDFTNLRNQVVTRFIFDTSAENAEQYQKFFHQLLLSLELELRIQSRQHADWAKEKLLQQMPPTIKWNLALAKRWREHVRIDEYGKMAENVRLRYKLKRRQVKMLRRFAQMMKWPNLTETLEALKELDNDMSLDDISSDAFAFFSGLILPGPTFPFLIMNTLIDVDPDGATDELALLSHMHPNCGFQYRNSYTYWTATCIVGKVLAPTCHSVAGWVGPARPTTDLGRSQIARIRSRKPKQKLSPEDVESMAERSNPLGPPAEAFPVNEYQLVIPDAADAVDTVRIELLTLKAGTDRVPGPDASTSTGLAGPRIYDATVQFAIDGVSWPLRLMYDVSFVSAWPCADGPHPLFFDYVYETVKVDGIVNVRDWGGLYASASGGSARSSPMPGMMQGLHAQQSLGRGGHGGGLSPHPQPQPQRDDRDEDDDEKVLVVEAFGVKDNEVLARAWCSHWGLSAVVADVKKTCMACAIREAYAATLTVVILVQGQEYLDDE